MNNTPHTHANELARMELQREAHAIVSAANIRVHISQYRMSEDEHERASWLIAAMCDCIGELHTDEAIDADVLEVLLADRDTTLKEFTLLMDSVDAVQGFAGDW